MWEFKIHSFNAFLTVNCNEGVATFNGERFELSSSDMQFIDGQIFFDKGVVENIFYLDIEYSALTMRLTAKTTKPWPVDVRKSREFAWRRFGINAVDPLQAVSYPFDYSFLGDPQVSVDFSIDEAFNSGLNLNVVTEALYFTNRFSANFDNINAVKIGRFNSSRQDHRGNLFGVKNLYGVNIGDVIGFRVPLSSANTSGIGIVLDGRPLTKSNNLHSNTISGLANKGWDAELYLSGNLYDFQVVDESGLYRFDNVPFEFGNNNVYVKVFGPFGEEVIIDHSKVVGSRLNPGEFYWRAQLAQPNCKLFQREKTQKCSKNVAGSFEGELGLSNDISLGLSLARSVESVEENVFSHRDYFGMRVSPYINNRPWNFQFSIDDNSAFAYSLETSIPLFNRNFSFSYQKFDPSFGPNANHTNFSISERIRLGSSIILPFPFSDSASLSFLFDKTKFFSETFTHDSVLRFNHSIGQVKMVHVLRHKLKASYVDNIENESANYSMIGNFSFGVFDFNFLLDLDLIPYAVFNGFSLNSKFLISNSKSAWVSTGIGADNKIRFSAGFNHRLERFNVSVNTSYAAGDVSVGVALSTSFGYTAGYKATMQSANIEGGKLLATVSSKDESNGNAPLQGVQLNVNGLSGPTFISDVNGLIYLDNLPTQQPVIIKVLSNSLPDPFLVAKTPVSQVWLRAGKTFNLPIEFVESIPVTGFVYMQFPDKPLIALPRMHVQLLDQDHHVREEVISLSDGSFEFQTAYAGDWYIRLKPDQPRLSNSVTSKMFELKIVEGEYEANINIIHEITNSDG